MLLNPQPDGDKGCAQAAVMPGVREGFLEEVTAKLGIKGVRVGQRSKKEQVWRMSAQGIS